MVTPATLQPCSGKTRMAPLALCMTLGRSGSEIHAAQARSSASSSSLGSNQAAAPPVAARATSLTFPVPSAQLSTVATPRGSVPCSASQGASSPAERTEASSSTPAAGGGAVSSAEPGSTARSRSRREGLRISRVSRTRATAVRS